MPKYTNIILTIIAVMLAAISLRLWEAGIMLRQAHEGGKYLVNAYQGMIASNKQLEEEIARLRKQIQETGDKIVKK